ncbi:serine hydrolase [Sphingomonas oleivorans]|uniref:Serine hydrolase n=1 Tax=Sphingomonas oleivorans TaxID=1735121 RepID=A0A2T5G0V6_9SPHN|nr:serine hydrolase domain-containing protein [Sphingomonas oleivorans]PTQ12795.1 serine hydrolase [Sphingomonas oleivorans]
MRPPLLLRITFAALAIYFCGPVKAEPSAAASVRLPFTRSALGLAQTQGMADPASGRRVTADDPVRVASVSKLAVAIAVLRLVEQGRLDLDADVARWLGYPIRNPAFPDRPVTLRLLLSHRSGLRDGIDYALPLDATLKEALAQPAAWDDAHPPGHWFRYANLNFPVIASVMEAATGERFDRLMARLLFAPLGLDACFNWTTCSDRAINHAVVLHDATGRPVRDDLGGHRPTCPVVPGADGGCDLAAWRPGQNGATFSPQGGMRISTRGLARIGQVLLNNGRIGRTRLLSPASVDLLLAPLWRFDGANGDTEGGFYCSYGLASQTLATSQAGCRDDPFGDGLARTGHAGEAYGLRSGLWIDRAKGQGLAYFITRVADDAPKGSSAYTAAEEALAQGR